MPGVAPAAPGLVVGVPGSVVSGALSATVVVSLGRTVVGASVVGVDIELMVVVVDVDDFLSVLPKRAKNAAIPTRPMAAPIAAGINHAGFFGPLGDGGVWKALGGTPY